MVLFWGITFSGIAASQWLMILVVVVLILISATASGAETAFFSLKPADVKLLRERHSSSSDAIINLLGDVDLLLATILVLNNLANIAIVVLTSSIIDATMCFELAQYEFVFKSIFVTFVLLLFGEIIPKVLSQSAPLSFANFAAQPILLARKIFYPLSFILIKMGNTISSRASQPSEISLDELADAVDITHTDSKEERVMLSGIINFVNTEVSEIMRPRVDITAIALTDSYENVKKLIVESGYSRIPIYDSTLDEIRGVLYVKDMLPYVNIDNFGWQKYIRKPYFVPEHKKINDLLEEFQSNKVHMAIVVDEYGSTLGLVSLEDIIEEIVGEISDDSDHDESFYTKIDDKTYIFDGRTHIGDFERVLEMDEDSLQQLRGQAETLAGLILEVKRSFPKVGDSVAAQGVKVIVHEMGGENGRRIDKVKVIIG